MDAHRHSPRPLARLVHLLLLLGWLLSSHGIAPAVCMAAAVIDGEHKVKVGASNDGELTVVLSHAGKSAAELASHEHDALCRVLVAFAAPPSPGTVDHVLAFKPVDDASSSQRALASAQVAAKAQEPSWLATFSRAGGSAACYVSRMPKHVWSQGLALKCGRTVMRC